MIGLALLRFLKRTPWSTTMALLGVTLGVTSIVSVHLVSAQIARQMDELIPGPLRVYHYVLQREALSGTDFFKLQTDWLSNEGAADATFTPVIDESVSLADVTVRVVGVDMLQSAWLSGQQGTQASAETSDASRGDAQFDLWRGIWVGDGVPVQALPLASPAVINGRLSTPGVVLADIGLAQELVGWHDSDALSYIGMRYPGPQHDLQRWLDQLLPGASAGLPELPPPVVPGYSVQSLAAAHPANQFGKSILFNISALGSLALVVSWFLIYQVAVFWLRRLSGVFTRLRVLGVGEGALAGYFLSLISALGVLAGAVGTVLGLYLARALLAFNLGIEHALEVDGWLLFKAMGSAVGVCLIGGGWAFRRALAGPLRLPRWQHGGLFVLMSAGVVAGITIERLDLAGAFTAIALLSLGLTFLMTPLLEALRSRSRLFSGNLFWKMSLREVVWFPNDLSVAVSGLSLAIATAIGVGLMVDSFRSDFTRMLDQRLSYEYSLDANGTDLQATAQRLALDPSVTRLQIYRTGEERVANTLVSITRTRMDAFEASRYSHGAALDDTQVLVGEQFTRLTGLNVADTVEIEGSNYTIAGVFQSFGDLLPRIVMPVQDKDLTARITELRLITTTGRPPALDAAWQSQSVLRDSALATFDQTFVITAVLIAIAVGVAGIGVYIAVTVMRLNQRTSSRLLESMGISGWEVWGIDLARGIGVGGLACVLALPLGTAFGWILCEVVNPRAFGWSINLLLEPQPLLMPMVWGVIAAALASCVRLGSAELAADKGENIRMEPN